MDNFVYILCLINHNLDIIIFINIIFVTKQLMLLIKLIKIKNNKM